MNVSHQTNLSAYYRYIPKHYSSSAKKYIDSGISVTNHVGGICGKAANSKIYNCTNNGKVLGSVNNSGFDELYVSGVSNLNNDSKIWCCKNSNIVSVSSIKESVVTGIGYGGSISNCYNTGNIHFERNYSKKRLMYTELAKES